MKPAHISQAISSRTLGPFVISGFRCDAEQICAFLWYYAEDLMVISYRRYGTIYWSHLQGSTLSRSWIPDPRRWYREVVPIRRWGPCVISQNCAEVTCTVTLPSKNMIVNIHRKTQHKLLSKSSNWAADNSRITNVKTCIISPVKTHGRGSSPSVPVVSYTGDTHTRKIHLAFPRNA